MKAWVGLILVAILFLSASCADSMKADPQVATVSAAVASAQKTVEAMVDQGMAPRPTIPPAVTTATREAQTAPATAVSMPSAPVATATPAPEAGSSGVAGGTGHQASAMNGTLDNPVPIGASATRSDPASIFLPYEVRITVLDALRGPAAQILARKNFPELPYLGPESNGEYVAVKIRLEVPEAPVEKRIYVDGYYHFGFWYQGDDYPYGMRLTPDPLLDGYAPVAGEGWAYFTTRKGLALPRLYFRHDMWWGVHPPGDRSGVFFALEGKDAQLSAAAFTPTPAAADSQSGSWAEVLIMANLREGPGTNYPVIGMANEADALQIVGKDAEPATWWQIQTARGVTAWINAALVNASTAGQVEIAAAPPPPVAAQVPAATGLPAATRATAQPTRPPPTPLPSVPPGNWVLVADSAADYPGPVADRNWWYLWSSGRNNFRWQEMSGGSALECYHSPNHWALRICVDTITADPRGDVAIQWKVKRGGTYRFEWDSDTLLFYHHLVKSSSQRPGTTLKNSAVFEDLIDWDMFFWVARANTSYHIRVYRLEP